jgi:hypothetical protein
VVEILGTHVWKWGKSDMLRTFENTPIYPHPAQYN